MATIKAYDTAAGKRYRVRYRKPDKSQTDKRGFRTKREAELFAASVTVSKATGDYIDPRLGRTTVAHLAPAWLATKKASLKPSSYAPLEGGWVKHVEPEFGHREIASIKPSEVQAWVSGIGKSATTAKRVVGILSGILETAIADRLISRNPAAGIATARKAPKPRVYLTHQQVHALAETSRYPGLVLTLAYTGLRWGEATGLRVRNCDRKRRRLTVEENAVMVERVILVGTPKTHEKRSVPYPEFLSAHLTSAAKGKTPDLILFGDGIAHMRRPNPKDGWFAAAVLRAQAADKTFPRITPHDLRHTAASLAISAGANVKSVQRMLGHASAAMTLDSYADLFEDDLDGVATRLGEAASAALTRAAA